MGMHTMNGNKRGPPPQRPREMTHSQHEELIKGLEPSPETRNLTKLMYSAPKVYLLRVHQNSKGEELFKQQLQMTWNRVYREVQQQAPNSNIGYYHEPNLPLKDFEPFDLEALWGRRLHQNITQHS
ncbi:hypothetical protein J6590_097473 [Homalodisca vitripennis]|nr:hypothetical protein J6590_097473 [Homalodisca vitripennis]